jgi:hypothetical protein
VGSNSTLQVQNYDSKLSTVQLRVGDGATLTQQNPWPKLSTVQVRVGDGFDGIMKMARLQSIQCGQWQSSWLGR